MGARPILGRAARRSLALRQLRDGLYCAPREPRESRGVAQSGSALRSGRRGRWFESSRPDHSRTAAAAHARPRATVVVCTRESSACRRAQGSSRRSASPRRSRSRRACGLRGAASREAQLDVRVHVERVVIDDNDTPVVVLEEEGGNALAADLDRQRGGALDRARDRVAALAAPQHARPRPRRDPRPRRRGRARRGHRAARRHLLRDAAPARAAVGDRRRSTRARATRSRSRCAPHAPIFVREPLFAQGNAEPTRGSDEAPRREI